MAGQATAITAEEFATWLTPNAALESLKHLGRRTALITIFERLKYEHIRSVARKFNFKQDSGEFLTLGGSIWRDGERGIAVSEFWETGDITIQVRERSATYGSQEYPLALFGVRLDPAGIQELRPAVTSADSETATPAPSTKGPPVAEPLLKAWFELYSRAYQGSADTEDVAVRSAQGMFPGKSVARQRVRHLRGAQKRGRKSREPNP
jgi:hypothetical protein